MEIETLQASPQAAKEMADILAKTIGTQPAPVAEEKKPEEVKVVEKKKSEEVVATEEKKTEVVTEEKKPSEKLWFETTEEKKPVEVEDTTDYKSEYNALISDPVLKAIAEAKKAGKNVAEVIKELQPVDYKSMSLEQLAESYGKSKGWSDDDISDEIGKMEGKTRTEIENITSTWLNKLESDQAGKMEKFAATHRETAEEQKRAELHIQKTFESDIKAECELMLANEINGVKLTKDHVNDFIKTSVEFSPTREDGTWSREALRYNWLGKNLSLFMGAAKAEGASEGRGEVLDEIHRPNLQTSQPQRLPEVKKPLTAEQEAEALINARLGRK